MYELPDLSRLSIAEKDALILALFEQAKQVDRLTAMVQMLSSRVEELEGRLRKDSHNSSKPPSSDGLSKKNQSLRQRSGRKPGGQSGHGGSTLKVVKDPDVIVEHALAPRCHRCGAGLGAQAQGLITVRRQVFDLLRPVLHVTEHRGYELHCACALQRVSRRCSRPCAIRAGCEEHPGLSDPEPTAAHGAHGATHRRSVWRDALGGDRAGEHWAGGAAARSRLRTHRTCDQCRAGGAL